jgi:hypothetical protein
MSNNESVGQMIRMTVADMPEMFTVFAYVIDGEVAYIHPVPNGNSAAIAALQSSPTIVELANDDKTKVRSGWEYNGESFSPPQI